VVSRVEVASAGWVGPGAEPESVDVQLCYDSADPLAVTIALDGAGLSAEWTLSRDLLAEGLLAMSPLGEGRIQVQASSVLTDIHHLEDDGTVTLLRVPWWNTREFIRLSQELVARGEEVCDVDGWVAQLTPTQEP
jgi:hypothetical protein